MGLTEGQLRRQGIECLVSVLRSLVTWSTVTGKGDDTQSRTPSRFQAGEEEKRESGIPDGPTERLSVTSAEPLRQPTPEVIDDPTRFESAKQKKTTLLQGLKKFNFKPKRVSVEPCQSFQILKNSFRVSISSSKTGSFLVEHRQT